MLRMPKAGLGFKQDKPGVKTVFGQGVINALTTAEAAGDNPFKSLPVSISDLQDANDTLANTAAAAETGAYADEEALEAAEVVWDINMVVTANYVSNVAAVAVWPAQMIRRAGFVPTKEASNPQPLPLASDSFIVANNGKKGAIIAENQKKIDHSKGYVYAALPEGATAEFNNNVMKITIAGQSCYIVAGTKRRVDIYNLPQEPLNVFVYGFNAAGSGPACQPVAITPGIIHN